MDEFEVTPTARSHSIALVVQGPVLTRHSFTFMSLKYYRRLLPHSRIIFSTWRGLDIEMQRKLDSHGVELVENDPPEVAGFGNLNFQIRSTKAGLERLENSKVELVVKLRSDQRIYNPNSFAFMRELLAAFPRQDNSPRLGASSLNSFLTRTYSLSDMLQFSSLDSISQLWALSEVNQVLDDLPQDATSCPEALLVFTYLQSLGWKIENSDATWRRAIAEEFLIADSSSLDQFWQKYSKREHLWRRYTEDEALQELDFGIWLMLRANKGN